MKKPIELWQALIATALFLITVSTIIINQSNRITRDEDQIQSLLRNNDKSDQRFDHVDMNLEKMNNRLTDIIVELQNKQNRPK